MVSRCILRKLERLPLTEVARSAVERSEQIFEGITTKCIAGDKPVDVMAVKQRGRLIQSNCHE